VKTADFEILSDGAMATIFAFYMWSHWRHLANTTEPSMCSGNAALCQITLTTCRSVCRSVCHTSQPWKTAAPIEVLFRLGTRVGPGNHVLGGRPEYPWEGAIFREEWGVPL